MGAKTLSLPPYGDDRIEALVDGMRTLLSRNLIASTPMIQDANIGDRAIYVANTMRFEKGEEILIRDNDSQSEEGVYTGMEFNRIAQHVIDTNLLILERPLTKTYPVSRRGRIQKPSSVPYCIPKTFIMGIGML